MAAGQRRIQAIETVIVGFASYRCMWVPHIVLSRPVHGCPRTMGSPAGPGRGNSGKEASMDTDRNPLEGEVPPPGLAGSAPAAGWVPLPEPGDAAAESRRARRDGVRHVRRMSNWTAAALIAGTGAAAVALAHHAFPVSAPAASTAATTGVGGTAVTNGAGGPQVSHPVATTSGSGVVVTTQTKTVNGKVVVTQVRRPAAYHDY
jgi:hypothetical protein